MAGLGPTQGQHCGPKVHGQRSKRPAALRLTSRLRPHLGGPGTDFGNGGFQARPAAGRCKFACSKSLLVIIAAIGACVSDAESPSSSLGGQ